MKPYVVASSNSPKNLEKKVAKLMAMGYKPIGDLVIDRWKFTDEKRLGHRRLGVRYVQPLAHSEIQQDMFGGK